MTAFAPRSLLARAAGLTLAFSLAVSPLPGASALQVSDAQATFNRVNNLLETQYGGLSKVDRTALRQQYQARLDDVCRDQPTDCPASKAYPLLESELTALGDEHTFFLDPDDFKDFTAQATGGNRRQFGVKLAKLDGENRVVTEVIPESAAQIAGLMRGDVLVTINGQPYTYDLLRKAREAGTPTALTLTRRGVSITTTITSAESSTRELPTEYFMPALGGQGEVAVIRIPTFLTGGGVAQTVHDLVGKAQERGAVGILVDLRGNPGGSLFECDNAVSAFVPTVTRVARSVAGTSTSVVSQGARTEDGESVNPQGSVRNPKLWTGPVAVLVDQSSASCSEFFAYEVQYAARGPIIGQETAGVGNTATRVFRIGDAGLQLTILYYAKPDGQPYPTDVKPNTLADENEDTIRQLTLGVDTLLNEGLKALVAAPALGSGAATRP